MTIQKMIEFIANFDPEFAQNICGAAPHKITAFERLIGQPLPSSYREFLAAMGASMDWLQPTQARFNIDTLSQYYHAQEWRPGAGYLKIGLGENDPFFDIYLESDGTGEPRVVTMPRGPTDNFDTYRRSFRYPLAGTLEEYLATSAYRTLSLNRLPHALRLAGDDRGQSLLARIAPLLASFGLKPAWFSNDWVQVFVSRNVGVIATQFPGGVLAIDFAASDPETLEQVRLTLTQNVTLPHAFSVRGR